MNQLQNLKGKIVMKLTIISDTHLGDPECTLVRMDKDGSIVDGIHLEAFFNIAGQNNKYLIVLGDMLDFAINDYGDVYRIAQHFFKRLKSEGVLQNDGEIIYVPGNHDYNIWHTIEHEANIINRMKAGKPLRKFKMSVPLILDDRTNHIDDNISLVGVRKRSGTHPYGGMFLDSIISPSNPLPFIVVFPNIYFYTRDRGMLLTHGQYLEPYWAITSELYRLITEANSALSIKDFISVNFPLGQIGSSGIGQAGPLTDLALNVQKDVSSGDCILIKEYLTRLVPFINKHLDIPLLPEKIEGAILNGVVSLLVKELKKIRHSDYISDLDEDSETRLRFARYIDSSMKEIELLQANNDLPPDLPAIKTVLFGHTHQPISYGNGYIFEYKGGNLELFNSGGWLQVNDDNSNEYGAEIFTYETGTGFSSSRIDMNMSPY